MPVAPRDASGFLAHSVKPPDRLRDGVVFDLWPAIADPERCPLPVDMEAPRAAANRLADLISPALAQHLLAPLARRAGQPLVDPARAAKGLLLNRFTRQVQIDCARRLHDAGIPVVYMKGFANAHLLYASPDARIAGDLDALVEAPDVPRVVALLKSAGFRFRVGDGARWGFVATSSYIPFVSADGGCNLDLHTAPDSDPLDRALSAAQVFAESRPMVVDGLALRAPSAEHALVIALSNIAKDRFGPFAAKKLIDAGRLVGAGSVAWERVMGILGRASLPVPTQVALALLTDLGFPGIPRELARPPRGAAGRAYAHILAETRALYPAEERWHTALWRELLLGGGWRVALRRNARRLGGLVRPARGIPKGA